MTGKQIIGWVGTITILGSFAYFASKSGVRVVKEPKVGDIVSIRIGEITIDGIRITHISGNDYTGVNKDGKQSFDRRDILQNSLKF